MNVFYCTPYYLIKQHVVVSVGNIYILHVFCLISQYRYRNFRTFTSPRPVQFSCLAVDNSGEIVCAGGRDVFEIFVWSVQTGRLLEVRAIKYKPQVILAIIG